MRHSRVSSATVPLVELLLRTRMQTDSQLVFKQVTTSTPIVLVVADAGRRREVNDSLNAWEDGVGSIRDLIEVNANAL